MVYGGTGCSSANGKVGFCDSKKQKGQQEEPEGITVAAPVRDKRTVDIVDYVDN